jgi:transposase
MATWLFAVSSSGVILTLFQKLPPCLTGIEACTSSHYWSRELQALGHTVSLMPPAYVRPYVKIAQSILPSSSVTKSRTRR